MKNNLFYYATSELSQDAFICYLASFGLKEIDDDPLLKECATQMMHLFVPEIDVESVVVESVERQIDHVDVLLTASCDGTEYKIIVEDKTFTSEHNNQLQRYVDSIQKRFPDAVVHGVFYKTGFQCNLDAALEAGYNVVTREAMLAFLAPYAKAVNNQIIREYYEYWNSFQEEVLSYQTTPCSAWNWKQIYGCYERIKQCRLEEDSGFWIGYDYVANQSGGFYGLWTGSNDDVVSIDGVPFEVYLQIEATPKNETAIQLCLKLSCSAHNGISDIKRASNTIIYDDDGAYRLSENRFRRPHKIVSARHMTIGIFDAEYRDADSLLKALNNAISEYKRILGRLTQDLQC